MSSFVDHLQFLPVPAVGGVRQPDGDHRPGGLGMLTLADPLVARGWTARVEDIGFDKPLPERRIAESYARAIADGVLSAWERDRFPILLTRVNYGALGVIDALGARTGLIWVSPRLEYAKAGLLRRPPVDRTALAMITGRAGRDSLAISPVRLPAERIVVVGGHDAPGEERRALAGEGARIVGDPGSLAEAVDGVDADRWYLHVDATGLASEAVPAADERAGDGIDPEALIGAVGEALSERAIGCVGLARYDLNRDGGDRTAATLTALLEATAVVAGGQPRPERSAERPAGA